MVDASPGREEAADAASRRTTPVDDAPRSTSVAPNGSKPASPHRKRPRSPHGSSPSSSTRRSSTPASRSLHAAARPAKQGGKARSLAEQKSVEIRLYEVIYDLVDDVTKAASGLLAPEVKLEVLGHAEVRQVFKISKVGMIAGCYVTDGVIERNAQIRVTRAGIVVEKDRRLEQLKRFKDDAKEVRAGNECGMKIVGYDDIKEGDVLECYRTTTVSRSLPEKR